MWYLWNVQLKCMSARAFCRQVKRVVTWAASANPFLGLIGVGFDSAPGHRASVRRQQFSKQAVKSKDAVTVLRHSNAKLHLGVTVLLRCPTTLLYCWLTHTSKEQMSQQQSKCVPPKCPEYIICDAPPPATHHVINPAHFPKLIWTAHGGLHLI